MELSKLTDVEIEQRHEELERQWQQLIRSTVKVNKDEAWTIEEARHAVVVEMIGRGIIR